MTIYIQDPTIKNQYRSTGIVRGIYLPSDTASAFGVLITRDGVFSAELFRRWWKAPKEEQVWNCWLKTLNSEPSLHFILKGTYKDEQGDNRSPDSIPEDRFSIRGNLRFWNEEKGNFAINIYPNKDAIRSFTPFFVEIEGELVDPKPGAFWEVEAVRKGDKLVLVEAQEVFPPFKKKKGKGKYKGKDQDTNHAEQTTEESQEKETQTEDVKSEQTQLEQSSTQPTQEQQLEKAEESSSPDTSPEPSEKSDQSQAKTTQKQQPETAKESPTPSQLSEKSDQSKSKKTQKKLLKKPKPPSKS
jgi:hypothetical protein